MAFFAAEDVAAVICTRGVRGQDESLYQAAVATGIPVALAVSSWDNITTKGLYPAPPRHTFVWNEQMGSEVAEFYGAEFEVCGVPQFDLYTGRPAISREEFLSKLGAPPTSRLLLYSTMARHQVPSEPQIARLVYDIIRTLDPSYHLLVRLHQQDDESRYSKLRQLPGVTIDMPGTADGGFADRVFDEVAMTWLHSSLFFADVAVNVASTMSLDAAMVGTPAVNVGFDLPQQLPYMKSARRYHDIPYYQALVRTGAVDVARSPSELDEAIRRAIRDPLRWKASQEVVRRSYAWRQDGFSARRLGDAAAAWVERTVTPRWPSNEKDRLVKQWQS